MTETVMTFNNLTKAYDETEVLTDVNAEVQKGDVIGLVGLNGAGKTTLLELGLGFGEASSGCATVFGIPSTKVATMDIKA